MPCAELFDHLKFCEAHSFVWCGPIEANIIVVAGLIKSVDLVEYNAEHGKRVQLLIDLLHRFSNHSDSVLHSKESISHD